MPARILIAEDDESIVASLEFLMRRCGYELRTVRDGAQAIAIAEALQPHVVILDVMLPRCSGLDVCRAIRASSALRETRILMLTARGGTGERARGLAAGADEYLTKPFSTHDLVARVKALVDAALAAASPPAALS
jgi:DNA-binding response OmpR family regulator